MKWRSVSELPKIGGWYHCVAEVFADEKRVGHREFVLSRNEWECEFKIYSWLDPEVPEEFLKPMEPEKKPCPWCEDSNWTILKKANGLFIFKCDIDGCVTGPEALTAVQAEAAIFERVK